MKSLLLFILSLAIAQPALAQGYSPWTQKRFSNCVPSIKPGPLSWGLGFLWVNIGGLQFDLVHGSYGVNTGGAAPQPDSLGEDLQVGSGGVSFENEPAVVTTDNNNQGNGEVGVDGTNTVSYFTAASTLDFGAHVFIATISNNSPWILYIDGVPHACTNTVGSTYLSLSGVKVGVGGYHDGSTFMAGASIAFAAEFNRILTPAEALALSMDPVSSLLQCPR